MIEQSAADALASTAILDIQVANDDMRSQTIMFKFRNANTFNDSIIDVFKGDDIFRPVAETGKRITNALRQPV